MAPEALVLALVEAALEGGFRALRDLTALAAVAGLLSAAAAEELVSPTKSEKFVPLNASLGAR